jgi:hypothetical protein
MIIQGITGGPAALSAIRKATPRRSGAAFAAPPEGAEDPPAIAPATDLAPLDALLALQETQAGLVGEREARRYGQAVLAELARLQLALLAPAGLTTPDLHRLAALCDQVPYAEDPTLAALIQSVVLRARIEIARR